MRPPQIPQALCHSASFWPVMCALVVGCGSLELSQAPSALTREAEHRDRYRTDGDPEALGWLLANRIQSGMSVTEVNRVLGDDGKRQFDDRWLKTSGGHYRSGDISYKWGPDNKGRGLYLVFRDGHLVNFDPSEFEQDDSSGTALP